MTNFYGYGPNQAMINQLMKQKENIDNMISQYSQPQAPVQNFINTNSVDFEARVLRENETPENMIIHRRTMFLDKKNRRVCIKETDGTISENYEIVVPLDEKDQKINELQAQVKNLSEENIRSNEALAEMDNLKEELSELKSALKEAQKEAKKSK